MKIDEKQIEEIAELARIKLSKEEKNKYLSQFEAILEYFEQLKEVNTQNVTPFIHAAIKEKIMRNDVIESYNKEDIEKILEQVPDKKGKYIKVKKVL